MKRFNFRLIYEKYKHAAPLIVYAIIYLTWFVWLEQNVTKNYKVIHVALDDYIPFCEWFVIPYFLWFAYVSIVVLWLFSKIRMTITEHVSFFLQV